jgi:hypothetical protein
VRLHLHVHMSLGDAAGLQRKGAAQVTHSASSSADDLSASDVVQVIRGDDGLEVGFGTHTNSVPRAISTNDRSVHRLGVMASLPPDIDSDNNDQDMDEREERERELELRRSKAISFFLGLDRPYEAPSKRQQQPQFDRDDVRACIEVLGAEWDPEWFDLALRRYHLPLGDVFFPGYIFGLVFCVFQTSMLATLGAGLLVALICGPMVTVMLWVGLRQTATQSVIWADKVFFREICAAEKRANSAPSQRDYAVTATIGHAGKAARALFRSLQGSRRTWSCPPAVADRAATLVFPLINVDVDKNNEVLGLNAFLYAYPRFLHDAASLVILGRVDLLPKLRAHYTLVARRGGDEVNEIPDRDARYLDSMRDHDRGRVVRDFVLPLASWLIALAALTVSILK